MAKQDPSRLTSEQLGALASATLHNSIELLRDAEGLATFGRYPRAYSLAVLAAEEFGKHMMCFGAVARDRVDPDAWPAFWKRFKEHARKYENAASMAASVLPPDEAAEFANRFREHVSADQERRLAGLYVGWRDGEIVTPDDVVTPELVSDLLTVFTHVIYSWAERWRDVDFGTMFAAAESEAAIMQEALVSSDPEAVLRAFERTLGHPGDTE